MLTIGVIKKNFDEDFLLSENYCNVKNTIFARSEIFGFSRANHQTWIYPKPTEIHQELHQMSFLNVKYIFLLFLWSEIFWLFIYIRNFKIFENFGNFQNFWSGDPGGGPSIFFSLQIKSIIITRLSWKFERLTQRIGFSDGS